MPILVCVDIVLCENSKYDFIHGKDIRVIATIKLRHIFNCLFNAFLVLLTIVGVGVFVKIDANITAAFFQSG